MLWTQFDLNIKTENCGLLCFSVNYIIISCVPRNLRDLIKIVFIILCSWDQRVYCTIWITEKTKKLTIIYNLRIKYLIKTIMMVKIVSKHVYKSAVNQSDL